MHCTRDRRSRRTGPADLEQHHGLPADHPTRTAGRRVPTRIAIVIPWRWDKLAATKKKQPDSPAHPGEGICDAYRTTPETVRRSRFLVRCRDAVNPPGAGPIGPHRPSQFRRGRRDGRRRRQRQETARPSPSASSPMPRPLAFPAARLEPGHYTLKARAAGYELDGAERPPTSPPARTPRPTSSSGRSRTSPRSSPTPNGWSACPAPTSRRAPAQLQRLPHARTHHEVVLRRRRVPADLPAHERLLSRQHAAQAAAARRRLHARSRPRRRRAGRSPNGSPASISASRRPGTYSSRRCRGSPASRRTSSSPNTTCRTQYIQPHDVDAR